MFCFGLVVGWLVVFWVVFFFFYYNHDFCYLGIFACGWMDVMGSSWTSSM